jgi:DNA-binding LytR/AlgR family response regulator
MKTLLISSGRAPLPDALREVIVRGSTTVDERALRQVDSSDPLNEVDRLVFWSPGDTAMRELAARCAAAEKREGREAIVFVTTDESEVVPGLSRAELFVWPRDEDRLVMAFMTGA